ncbi:MAG: FGGY family carbohydrate kinase [Gammaproteobacteria bacterium]|nr:FGGY family carbohydrate kinase [Gammaproteobacteria bacterium]
MPEPHSNALAPCAVALDLGSTRFKLGAIDPAGQLIVVESFAAPQLSGSGIIREGMPGEFLEKATKLLARAQQLFQDLPLALVCQRSTFLLWDRDTGEALTPVVSWQDRRADHWCQSHARAGADITRQTGLLLSPHYAGPKLAAMLMEDPILAKRLQNGRVLFGNLDTWLAWHWSGGLVHRTDVTMAARTAMFNIEKGIWSASLLERYNVPQSLLPQVDTSYQKPFELPGGLRWQGSIADQAASVSSVVSPEGEETLINLGTGTFVMRRVSGPEVRVPGYLTGPVLAQDDNVSYAIEGTINGAGPAIDSFGKGPTQLPTDDPHPEAFMIPDRSGYGAPLWRADVGLTLSPAAERLMVEQQRLICIEGLLFRIFEILQDLGQREAPQRLIISGGLAADQAIAGGLATLTGQSIIRLAEAETTLLGAARLAAGFELFKKAFADWVEPGASGVYLSEKYVRWQVWRDSILS